MINVRRSKQRGHFDHGWLNTYHTFSFGEYFDSEHQGFGPLRVMNEDRVESGQGFGMHAHHDMEIVTYVLEGGLEHRDSMGNHGIIFPGEVQRITAGTGIRHSEFNHSKTDPVHFLQIWIFPEKNGLEPSYEQKTLAEAIPGALQLVASPDPTADAVTIHQDAKLYRAMLNGNAVEYRLTKGRKAYLQVVRGEIEVNGKGLAQGDGAAVVEEEKLYIQGLGQGSSEMLLFDLA